MNASLQMLQSAIVLATSTFAIVATGTLRLPTAHATEGAHSKSVVVVDPADLEAVDPWLEDTLRELLERVQLELVSLELTRGRSIAAYVDFLNGPDGVVVSARAAVQAEPVRRNVPRAPTAALFREILAHVVLGLVESLIHTEPVGPSEPPAPPAREPEDQVAGNRASRGPAWWLAVQAGPVFLAENSPTAAFAGAFGVRFERSGRPSLALEGGGAWPVRIDKSTPEPDGGRAAVEARLAYAYARVAALIALGATKRVGFDAGLAAGVDVMTFTPRYASSPAVLEPRSRRVQPIVGPRFAAWLRTRASLQAALVFGVDLDGAPRRWVAESGPEQTTLLALWRARPYAALRLTWSPHHVEEPPP